MELVLLFFKKHDARLASFNVIISAAFTTREILKWVFLTFVLFSKVFFSQFWNMGIIHDKQEIFFPFPANLAKKKKKTCLFNMKFGI